MAQKRDKTIRKIKNWLETQNICYTNYLIHFESMQKGCSVLNDAIEKRDSEKIKRTIGALYIRLFAYIQTNRVSENEYCYTSGKFKGKPVKSLTVDLENMAEITKTLALEPDELRFMDTEKFSDSLKKIAHNHGYTSCECMEIAFALVVPKSI